VFWDIFGYVSQICTWTNDTMITEINKHFRYNFTVNVLDGGFFGVALGLASFVTVLPLFVSTLTDSAILIGLVSAIHSVGWQLPQLLTVNRVARLSRYKPMVLLMTLHERLPFFGLALVAWFLPILGPKLALPLIFGLLVWQGLGGGFTATAWQSMIGKIMPVERRGIFFGTQSAAANLGGSLSAVIAGLLLERLASPVNFTLCFLLAGISMMISWAFLAQTREPERSPTGPAISQLAHRGNLRAILRRDVNFRWFLVARTLQQLATMAFGFYAVYAVRYYGMSEALAGLMTSVFMAAQIATNPVMGWVGDRWGHRIVMGIGAYAAAASALLAWFAPDVSWFYLVFGLAGVANVTSWTIGLAMTLEFGSEAERPAYIGLSNTLVAPSTILAPLIGGWLADTAGFPATFLVSAVGGLATALVLQILVRDPRRELYLEVGQSSLQG
jgi:MFS family permease